MTLLLSILCGILFLVIVFAVRLLIKASRQIQGYEQFYGDTLEDVSSVINMLKELMDRRQILSDDPDVQNVYRVIVITHDILVGYVNANNKKEEKERKKLL